MPGSWNIVCPSFSSQLQGAGQARSVRGEKCPPGGDHFTAGGLRGGRSSPKNSPDYLQHHSPGDACPWTVFDRNLMDKVLEDHNLPTRLAKFLPEDRVSQMEDILADVFEVHPPAETIVHQSTETILKLAGLGNVILIGRGGTVITAKLPHVLHVRLVAPLEKRIEHARQFYQPDRSRGAQVLPEPGPRPGTLSQKVFQRRHQRSVAVSPGHQYRPGRLR